MGSLEGETMNTTESYRDVIDERSGSYYGVIASWIVLSIFFGLVVLL